ncbi:hypothetical protein [Pseudanabaena galeata]|uniref:hypothetical protein n=1 Tax=Pseudanabaena galeata TaxID=1112103 RepID=UPI00247A5D69|nr:hypothetical protein [Pseudanabaena galeata]WGS73331.1 hypothetical protein OA858_04680 [Pseudanabaena galeata CCNP1313]
MMFIKKAFLGSLSFATVLIVGNWSGAIAQNAPKSTRYVSDQEIQVLVADSLARVAGGSRFFQERRSPSEISKINDFVNAWQKVDPSISPFLGDWGGWESSLAIYPSQTKGQVLSGAEKSEKGC